MQHHPNSRITCARRTPASWLVLILMTATLLASCAAPPDFSERLESSNLQIQSIEELTGDGGRLDWSPANGLIAFDRMEDNRYFAIHTMNPDGTDRRCLTCDLPEFDELHAGQPSWHPSGDWILFQAEKAEHPGRSIASRPGFGRDNDIWAIDRNGESAQLLHQPPIESAILHPYFSRDGSMLVWSEKDPAPPPGSLTIEETWMLRLADVSTDGNQFSLGNIREIGPDRAFYESHGFTPDNSHILFTANLDGQEVWGMDIYTYELATGTITNLTQSPEEWDEHAKMSPDGRYVSWMSSRECDCDPSQLDDLQTDIWIMKADGSNPQRVTYFSMRSAPERAGRHVIAGDGAWSPDGAQLAVRLIADRRFTELLGLEREEGPIMLISFDEN
jgi:Tol biopolymer transport system component